MQSASELGTRIYQVEATPAELRTTPGGLPALRFGAEPQVLFKDEAGRVVCSQGNHTLQVSELERRENFWVLSPSLQLRALAHKNPLQRLRAYLREEKDLVQLVVAYAVFVELLALAAPLTVRSSR